MRKYLLTFLALLLIAPCAYADEPMLAFGNGNVMLASMNPYVAGAVPAAAAPGHTVTEEFTSCANMTSFRSTVTCSGGVATTGDWLRAYAYSGTTVGSANHQAEIIGTWQTDNDYATPIVRCDGAATPKGITVTLYNYGANVVVGVGRIDGTGHPVYSGEGSISSKQLVAGTSYKMLLSANSSNQITFKIDIDGNGTYEAGETLTNFVTDSTAGYTDGTYVGVHINRLGDAAVNVDYLYGD